MQQEYIQKYIQCAKSKTLASKKKTSFKKLKLKAGKKYYVQVRTYKLVDGKKYCSKWSPKRAVKTKRR